MHSGFFLLTPGHTTSLTTNASFQQVVSHVSHAISRGHRFFCICRHLVFLYGALLSPEVLDDDFVRSPLSCLECILEAFVVRPNRPPIWNSPFGMMKQCHLETEPPLSPPPFTVTPSQPPLLVGKKNTTEGMLWHMRSHLHSLTLPFDMLGFPILEAP